MMLILLHGHPPETATMMSVAAASCVRATEDIGEPFALVFMGESDGDRLDPPPELHETDKTLDLCFV